MSDIGGPENIIFEENPQSNDYFQLFTLVINPDKFAIHSKFQIDIII